MIPIAMLKDSFKFALGSIRHRRLRSWLTIIGIFIGIAAVISLISISQGMQEAIKSQFERMGTNKLIIMPGGGGMMGAMGGSTTGTLTNHDIDLIKQVRGVESVAGMLFKMAKVSFDDEVKYTFIIGLPTDPESAWVMENYKVEGRYLKEYDRYKVVVGYLFSEARFFKKEVRLGGRLYIEDQIFKVVGMVEELGNRYDDSQVYIPMDVARQLLNEPTEIGMIYAKVREGYDPSTVADRIEEAMRDDRDQKPGEEDFGVQTSEQLMQQIGIVLGIIQLVLVGIAGISLMVGGVGIMNTMYTSVLERTREIGIMKAIGAKNHDIITIFLIEAGTFGLIGGIVGCALGIALAKGVEIYASYAGFQMLKASVTPWLIILGLALAFVIGCLSGILPARTAARLKPVDALRYE